jgi:GNAT superfamily N-acetyltransferase
MTILRTLHDPSEQKQAFLEALRLGLHLTEGAAPSRSRMENLATGHRTNPDGLTVVTLTEGGQLVGWATCEHSKVTFMPAITLKDGFRANSTVKQTHDWGYVPLGFFSVFVEPSQRGRGHAKALLLAMEQVRIAALADTIHRHPLNLPVFEAQRGSQELVKRFAVQSGLCPHPANSSNLKQWNHFLSSDRLSALSYGDPLPPEELWKARQNLSLKASPSRHH